MNEGKDVLLLPIPPPVRVFLKMGYTVSVLIIKMLYVHSDVWVINF